MKNSVPWYRRLSLSASVVMPNGDPRDGFSYPTLTLLIDSYNPVTCFQSISNDTNENQKNDLSA